MVVLVSCENEENAIKMKAIEWPQHGALIFQTLCQWWDLAKIRTHPSLNACLCFPSRMKQIQLKMKALGWPLHCSYHRFMGIFSNAQGQLNPHSQVESGRISNSSDILWWSSLPARKKKIQSKMKAPEWPQLFPQSFPDGSYLLPWKPDRSDLIWSKA